MNTLTRFPLRAIARAGLLLALLSSAAVSQAWTRYTSVTTEIDSRESLVGAPLFMPSGGGSATVGNAGLSLNLTDSTHWVGGPYAAASWSRRFGIAGALGTFESVTFTFDVSGHYGNERSADFTASYGFDLALSGYEGSGGAAGGTLIQVNCIGCGGFLESNGVSSSTGGTVEWTKDFHATYSFTALVERGWAEAGSAHMNGYLGLGSTWANLSVQLQSVTDGRGQALSWGSDGFLTPVPEPAPWALWAAGTGLLGLAGRRRGRAGSDRQPLSAT